MSHFATWVLLTPEQVGDGTLTEARACELVCPLLEPYDEARPVDPYFVPLRDPWMDLPFDSPHHGKSELAYVCERYKVDPTDHEAVMAALGTWNGSAAFVDGQYGRMSTYNPLSKWDWFEVGGRWGGCLPNGRNVCRVSDLPPDGRQEGDDWPWPYAVVDQHGGWHARGRMGWFGASFDEQEDDRWDAERSEVLSGCANGWIVLCDLHI